MSEALKMPTLGDTEFLHLQKLMADASGIQLAQNKRPLVAGRLMKRLRYYRLDSYTEYLHMLEQPMYKQERRLVVDLLTTNETYFFREHPHFEFLGQWLARRRGSLRIWSAACSSGEEPYSLAMVLSEHATTQDWSIMASDLSLSMLHKAHEGIYDIAQAKYFPQGWMQRYCLSGVGDMSGRFRVQAALRDRVTLREVNLVQPLAEDVGMFDVIFLRNVLIYFDNEEKKRIVQRLVCQLRPGGLLFIGHAESIHGFELPVRLVRPSVYECL
ncbi:protein-glutamate O-methyltransferase CheR [Pseudomonas sp. KFB-139]|uniref:Chemotaxis protein methyltransferase n=1 Tax=Pseudomonas serbiensis TaxID=3064350 RepID=A0ABT9CM58_9PSED|nr:protein-glutamate O-methyltransferase CheR [Pseudomonas sp. KFB-138]MDO7926578.1 protein-glutamate O-methyltransferase CheR [Pseudomonas sp. KFB-138]